MPQAAVRQIETSETAIPAVGPLAMPTPKQVLELVRQRVQVRLKGEAAADINDPRPTQTAAARAIGINVSTLNRFLDGTWAPTLNFARQAWDWLQQQDARDRDEADTPLGAGTAGERPLVITAAVRAVAKLAEVCTRQRTMGMLVAEAGCGKTWAMEDYARNHPSAIYFKCTKVGTSTVRNLVRQIYKGSGLRGSETTLDQWESLIKAFKSPDTRTLTTRVLLIDDAHELPYSVLEAVRDLYDVSEVPTVIAGTTRLSGMVSAKGDAFQMFEQLRSRIALVRTIGKPKPQEVEDVAKAWAPAGLELSRDAVAWLIQLMTVRLGGFRDVKHTIEAVARLPDYIKGTAITVDQVQRAAAQKGVLA